MASAEELKAHFPVYGRGDASVQTTTTSATMRLLDYEIKAGDTAGALESARKVVEMSPEWAKAHGRLGSALLANEEFPEAADAFRRALELDPGSAFFETSLSEAQQGERLMAAIGAPGEGAEAVEDGHLVETYGRAFHMILSTGRLCANEVGEIVPGLTFEGLQAMRSSERGLNAIRMLGSRMYSYWMQSPSEQCVYDMVVQQIEDMCGQLELRSVKGMQQREAGGAKPRGGSSIPAEYAAMRRLVHSSEVQHWGNAKYRIFGTFYAVKATRHGMLMLDADSSEAKAYLVVGIAESIARAFEKSRVPLPTKAQLTMLPFMGRMVYDGTLSGAPGPPPSQAEKRQLGQHLEDALACGNVVASIEVPLTLETADTGRPPELSEAGRAELAKVKALPMDSSQGNGAMWVVRRVGYSEDENPNHMAIFMAGPIPAPCNPLISAALDYTAEELAAAFVAAVKAAGRRPGFIAIDCLPALQGCQEAFKSILGIQAGYYPPPSEEEQEIMSRGP